MPVVWIARLLGIPIKNRVAGSDIFDALKAGHNAAKPLKVFLFGGAEGVAAAASSDTECPAKRAPLRWVAAILASARSMR